MTGARQEHGEIILYGFINEKTFRDNRSGFIIGFYRTTQGRHKDRPL